MKYEVYFTATADGRLFA